MYSTPRRVMVCSIGDDQLAAALQGPLRASSPAGSHADTSHIQLAGAASFPLPATPQIHPSISVQAMALTAFVDACAAYVSCQDHSSHRAHMGKKTTHALHAMASSAAMRRRRALGKCGVIAVGPSTQSSSRRSKGVVSRPMLCCHARTSSSRAVFRVSLA